jgi:hypothetical protein
MTTLLVELNKTGGLSFSPPVPFLSNAIQINWEELVSEFLHFYFKNKSLWIVVDEYKSSDWWYLDEDFTEYQIKLDKTNYLVTNQKNISTANFLRIVKTSDFYWDGIIFIPQKSTDIQSLHKIIADLDNFENISSFADGCGININLPSLKISEILSKLKEISSIKNFNLQLSNS